MNFGTFSNRKSIFISIFVSLALLFGISQLFLIWMENKVKSIIIETHGLQHIEKYTVSEVYQQSAVLSDSNDDIPMFQRLIELDTTVATEESTYQEQLIKAIPCYDRFLERKIEQHGNFWVLSNYIRASKQYRCFESITYTTHADYTFLDNLIPLVQRWNGPISIALHAPGTDFQPTLDCIAYLRNCVDPRLKKLVTFHLLFDMGHTPTKRTKKVNVLSCFKIAF